MNIQTAQGVRTFYNPQVPTYPATHVANVTDFVEFANNPRMVSGWLRKFPHNFVLADQLASMVCQPPAQPIDWPQHPSKLADVLPFKRPARRKQKRGVIKLAA